MVLQHLATTSSAPSAAVKQPAPSNTTQPQQLAPKPQLAHGAAELQPQLPQPMADAAAQGPPTAQPQPLTANAQAAPSAAVLWLTPKGAVAASSTGRAAGPGLAFQLASSLADATGACQCAAASAGSCVLPVLLRSNAWASMKACHVPVLLHCGLLAPAQYRALLTLP